jgi:hypothetical protein
VMNNFFLKTPFLQKKLNMGMLNTIIQ